jgi:hypothetical protein
MINDFRHLEQHKFVSISPDNKGAQIIKIAHPDNFIIELTVPDENYEWQIEVKDAENRELVSYWEEPYGEPSKLSPMNRQKEIEKFVSDLVNYELRYVEYQEGNREISDLQINRGNCWESLVRYSKLKD